MRSSAMWRGCVAAAVAVLVTTGARAADPIPVQAFFEKPAIGEATLSPPGRPVALTALNKDGHSQLVVVDTATLKPFVAAVTPSADVRDVHWASDRRLAFSLSDSDQKFGMYAHPAGLFAVDRDGTEHRNVLPLPGANNTLNFGYYPWFDNATWLEDSDQVFVAYPQMDSHGEMDYIQLRKVDTRTGLSTPFEGPPRPWGWDIGPGNEARVVHAREDKGRSAIDYQDRATHTWTKLETYDAKTGAGAFTVVGFIDDDNLYVTHRAKGTNESKLYTYNVMTKTYSAEPILGASGFDVHPVLIRSGDRILGLRYSTDAESTVWVDPEMKKVQAKVDSLLRNTLNEIDVPVRAEVPIVLVKAYSDTEPGQYFLYATKAEKLIELGHKRPAIDAAQMATRDFVRYKARDGLEIPAGGAT